MCWFKPKLLLWICNLTSQVCSRSHKPAGRLIHACGHTHTLDDSSHIAIYCMLHIYSSFRIATMEASSSGSRPAKLRRLEDLRRGNPYVSSSALSNIVKDIQQHGLPELHQRKHMQQARDARLDEHTGYGPLTGKINVMLKDGKKGEIMVVNIFTFLQALYEQNGGFTALVNTSLEKHPCSHNNPWDLIYYTDEIVPGNPLSAETSRKIQTAYLSFKQFGAIALSKEEAWLVAFAKRSSHVMEMEAGMSQVTAALLDHIFHHPSCSPDIGGLMLKDRSGGSIKLWFRLGMMLQDGAAHKAVWGLKGDAASKFCVFCLNLLTEKSNIVDESNEHLLIAQSWDLSQVQQASNDDVHATAKRLEQKHVELKANEFQLWQQAVGMNYNKYALLHWESLKGHVHPISQFLHDWMHCFLVSGIFQTVMHLIMTALEANFSGNVYDVASQVVGAWNLPAVRHDNLGKLFEPKRKKANKLAGTFKCTASEALGLAPIFAYFLQTIIVPKGLCKDECFAYFALVDILDLIQLVPLGIITHHVLERSSQNFINLCITAGWKPYMHTKFHWSLHFGHHLSKHKMLPSCFVQERKHKTIKRHLVIVLMVLHSHISFLVLLLAC